MEKRVFYFGGNLIYYSLKSHFNIIRLKRNNLLHLECHSFSNQDLLIIDSLYLYDKKDIFSDIITKLDIKKIYLENSKISSFFENEVVNNIIKSNKKQNTFSLYLDMINKELTLLHTKKYCKLIDIDILDDTIYDFNTCNYLISKSIYLNVINNNVFSLNNEYLFKYIYAKVRNTIINNPKLIKYIEERIHIKSNYNEGFSIVVCTNRPQHINNIYNNYVAQKYKNKELIILLNNNSMEVDTYKRMFRDIDSVKIIKINETKSLGYCINYGINEASKEYISKFDDDDYYSPNYLNNLHNQILTTDAKVYGKRSTFAYFKDNKRLSIDKPGIDNCYSEHIRGATLTFKREISEKVPFRDISLGEDRKFCSDCMRIGYKLYATDIFDYICIRHKDNTTNSVMNNEQYDRRCKMIYEGIRLKEIIEYIKVV